MNIVFHRPTCPADKMTRVCLSGSTHIIIYFVTAFSPSLYKEAKNKIRFKIVYFCFTVF